jgi:CubicO group peptidase (beta-lactamase class C family)
MKMHTARDWARNALAGLIGCLAAALLNTMPFQAACAAAPAIPSPEMTSQDLGLLFDEIVPARLKRYDIAGAAVTVVKDGKVIFSKGYGYADVAAKKPVSPADTLFRVEEVATLLTWSAVMQQVELGKIDLDADIQQYLDMTLPAAFVAPITMRQLMAHRAGFAQTFQGQFAADAAHLATLRDFITATMPPRIFAPGTVAAVSSMDATLAAYIVERVAAEPFAAYVQRHLIGPLGMRHTTLAQPLPASLAALLSKGYKKSAAGAQPFEWLQPSGTSTSMTTSAEDMAVFMIALLQEGSANGVQILKPETVALMQSPQFRFDPRENAAGLGMALEQHNGHGVLVQGGATPYFFSKLNLVPDAHLGMFVTYNSEGGNADVFHALFDKLMDRYFPYAAPLRAPLPTAARDAAKVAGYYMKTQRGEQTMAYIFRVLGQSTLSAGRDGTLVRNGRQSFRETDRDYWQAVDNPQEHMIFRQAADGHWFFSYGVPVSGGEQVAWYRSKPFVLSVLAFALAASVLTLLAWPVLALARRRRKTPSAPAWEQRARTWLRLFSVLHLLLWGGFLFMLTMTSDAPMVTASAWFDPALRLVQIVSWVGAAGLVLVLSLARSAWRTDGLWWGAKAHRTAMSLAFLASVWLTWAMNVLALHLRY